MTINSTPDDSNARQTQNAESQFSFLAQDRFQSLLGAFDSPIDVMADDYSEVNPHTLLIAGNIDKEGKQVFCLSNFDLNIESFITRTNESRDSNLPPSIKQLLERVTSGRGYLLPQTDFASLTLRQELLKEFCLKTADIPAPNPAETERETPLRLSHEISQIVDAIDVNSLWDDLPGHPTVADATHHLKVTIRYSEVDPTTDETLDMQYDYLSRNVEAVILSCKDKAKKLGELPGKVREAIQQIFGSSESQYVNEMLDRLAHAEAHSIPLIQRHLNAYAENLRDLVSNKFSHNGNADDASLTENEATQVGKYLTLSR